MAKVPTKTIHNLSSRHEETLEKLEKKGVGNRGSPSKYKPIELCDETVEDFARMMYTQVQVAERFGVSVNTLMVNHGEAFHRGRDASSKVPRVLLAKILRDFSDPDINLARTDANTTTLLKAMELHHKLHDNLGQKTEVSVTTNLGYDRVESHAHIIERPEPEPEDEDDEAV